MWFWRTVLSTMTAKPEGTSSHAAPPEVLATLRWKMLLVSPTVTPAPVVFTALSPPPAAVALLRSNVVVSTLTDGASRYAPPPFVAAFLFASVASPNDEDWIVTLPVTEAYSPPPLPVA